MSYPRLLAGKNLLLPKPWVRFLLVGRIRKFWVRPEGGVFNGRARESFSIFFYYVKKTKIFSFSRQQLTTLII